jgi:hypothetical protein
MRGLDWANIFGTNWCLKNEMLTDMGYAYRLAYLAEERHPRWSNSYVERYDDVAKLTTEKLGEKSSEAQATLYMLRGFPIMYRRLSFVGMATACVEYHVNKRPFTDTHLNSIY